MEASTGMDSELEESESSSPNIIIPQEWADAADAIVCDSATAPWLVAFVCGPRNSGKTTFSRYLVNLLLQRHKKVAYLDTDVGQTEFTPPGLLSLTVIDKIIPDLTIPCLKAPERCFFFGDVSSKRDPTTYMTYIHALYDHYRKEHSMPLVINTNGWVKGIGYDILVDILKYMSPSHVVKICISAEKKNLPAGAFWLEENEYCAATIIEMNSARQDSFNRSILIRKDAHLLRNLRMMAYFRQCFPSDMSITTIKELARALAAHPPFEVSISSVKIKHLYCQVPKSEIFYSLNASVVGLAVTSEGSESLPYCVGLGIVRGIDTLNGMLYIITPVPQNLLEKVDLLLQGYIQIPNCLLQVKGCISPYLAANVLPADI